MIENKYILGLCPRTQSKFFLQRNLFWTGMGEKLDSEQEKSLLFRLLFCFSCLLAVNGSSHYLWSLNFYMLKAQRNLKSQN